MNSKKIILLIILSSIIFSISYVGYYKFKIEKNSYIHSSTYVAGVNLSAQTYFLIVKLNIIFMIFLIFKN